MAKVEAACGLWPDATRRLAALGAWITEDAERLWQRLRLTNSEHRRLTAMAADWWRVSPAMGEAAAHALIYRLGLDDFTERAMLAWVRSDGNAADPAWHELTSLPRRWTAPAFPLRASDFIARGVEKGPLLGAALARAEETWIAAGFPLDQAALGAIIEDALRGG